MSVAYISKVEHEVQKNQSLPGTEVGKLLDKHGEIALHAVLTFTDNSREQMMLYLPNYITLQGFMDQVFIELGKQITKLSSIHAVQLYATGKSAKFVPSGTGMWDIDSKTNDSRKYNKWRDDFLIAQGGGTRKTTKKTTSAKSNQGRNKHKNVKQRGGSMHESLHDIYSDYIDHALDMKTINERYKKVYDSACKHLRDPVDLKISRRLIRYIYEKTDAIWFNGAIRPYLEDRFSQDLLCIKNVRLRSTAGRFSFGEEGLVPTLEIAPSVFAKLFTHGEKSLGSGVTRATNRLEFLIHTIHHELCHLIVLLFDMKNGAINGGHGPLFRKFIFNTFGHTDYKHQGFSGDSELADTMAKDLKPGYVVEYRDKKGNEHQGVVLKIRASYAVVKGHKYGIPYGKIIKIVDRSNKLPEPVKADPVNPVDLGKLSVGQSVIFKRKTKNLACRLLSYTSKRARLECIDDGKQWYVPWSMIALD